MTLPRFPTVILCEYAAQDTRNKHILAGVFAGDVVVDTLPAQLRLALYIEVVPEVSGDQEFEMIFSIKERVFMRAKIVAQQLEAGNPSVFLLPNIDLFTDQETALEIEVKVGSEEPMTILRKQIKRRPAPPQPGKP